MSPAVASFEVLRFEAIPAAAGVAVLELDGRFAGALPERPPRLLVEASDGATELPAVEVARDPWSATFAVPLAALADARVTFALVPGRGPLIALPAPSVANPDDDRFVRLARTVNELRHRLAEATARAGEADRLRGELADARARIAAGDRRAADAERAAETAREERDAAAGAAVEGREMLERARDEITQLGERADAAERDAAGARAAADVAQQEAEAQRADAADARTELQAARQAVASAERDAATARRELRDVRARLEALQRERSRPAAAAAGSARTERFAPDDTDETADDPADSADDTTRRIPVRSSSGEDDATQPMPSAAAEPTQTLELPADDLRPVPPEDEPDDSVRVLRPGAAGTRRTLPARRAAGAEDTDDVLGPAAVGARYIEPSSTRPTGLTPARMLVGAAVLLLFLALLVIFLGVV